MLLFFGCCLLYFTLSIPSNSISWDQAEAIRISKEILKGNFPLHGYKHSNGMYSFPAFYYFVSPLVYISDEPIFLYGSVAFFYIIGILLLANYISKKFGCFEFIIFLLSFVQNRIARHSLTMYISTNREIMAFNLTIEMYKNV